MDNKGKRANRSRNKGKKKEKKKRVYMRMRKYNEPMEMKENGK